LLLSPKRQSGAIMIEVLVAVALLGICGFAFISAIITSTKAVAVAQTKVNINNLARAQTEYTKNCPYIYYIYGGPDIPPAYQTIDELSSEDPYSVIIPAEYSISVDATALHNPDNGIQEITVAIFRDNADLLKLKSYKMNR